MWFRVMVFQNHELHGLGQQSIQLSSEQKWIGSMLSCKVAGKSALKAPDS